MNSDFRTWYSELPKSEYRKKRQEIIDGCRITRAVFYNWLSGATPVPSCHYHTINAIAGVTIFRLKL